MDLKKLEEQYRVLETDLFKMKGLKEKAQGRDDQLFWYIEMEATRKEMKKIAITFGRESAKELPKAA